VIEFQFLDFITLAMDQVVNHAAKLRYMTGGSVSVPLVIRAPVCGGVGLGAQHSQSLEAWFVHVPGLKVVMPSTPADAKGLLKSAIRDANPVLFLEHRLLYGQTGPVPEDDFSIPMGSADINSRARASMLKSSTRALSSPSTKPQ
jgi:pyruvate/2-oxoglutarate/acetoin dehydrogenase E1 component